MYIHVYIPWACKSMHMCECGVGVRCGARVGVDLRLGGDVCRHVYACECMCAAHAHGSPSGACRELAEEVMPSTELACSSEESSPLLMQPQGPELAFLPCSTSLAALCCAVLQWLSGLTLSRLLACSV